MFKSALIKLILWYVALVMALSLTFSFFLYHFSVNELKEGLNKQYQDLTITNTNTNNNNSNITEKEFNERATGLLRVFIYFNLIAFIGSTILSYFLAKQTLGPIKKAHQIQTRFAALASHELRTPLAAIKADTESVLMMANNNNQKILVKALRDNLRDVQRLEELTNHSLEVAKYQSSNQLNEETIDISMIIQQVITQIKHTKEGKNRKIIYAKDKAIMFTGDPLALKLLFSTLFDNAVKYSPKSSTINVALTQQAKKIVVTINNLGEVIDPHDLPYLFEFFYRSNNNRNNLKRKNTGFGLGLALAKQIVDLHQGKINITSMPNIGTTVIVILPTS